MDKIADVLRNPGHYSEQYPDTLPLTRKLYQQLGAKKLAKSTHGIVSHEPAQAVEPLRRPMQGLHFQHLDVNREDTVHPGHNSVRRDMQRHQGRPEPRSPAGEGETSTRSSPDSTLSIVEVDIVYDDEPVQPTHDGARPTHDRVQPTRNQRQHEIGVRALTWMDILERGEWPLPCDVEMGDLFVVSY